MAYTDYDMYDDDLMGVFEDTDDEGTVEGYGVQGTDDGAANATAATATGNTGGAAGNGGAGQGVAGVGTAGASQVSAGAQRIAELQQNTAAARGRLDTATGNINNVLNGNVKGLGDIIAQYGPKETPEQAEARKRRERTASNILAWTNMLGGVANVLTASHGTTGRSVKPVDVVKPYNEGIMAAEAARNANEAAREKARNAYLDKEMKRAQNEYNLALNDYKTAAGAEEGERKRQADMYNKDADRKFKYMQLLANNENKKLDREQRERASERSTKLGYARVAATKEGNSIRRDELNRKIAKDNAAKRVTNIIIGKNASDNIDLPYEKWKESPENIEKIFNIMQSQGDGSKWVSEAVKAFDATRPEELKSEARRIIVEKYMNEHEPNNPVSVAMRELAGEPTANADDPLMALPKKGGAAGGTGSASGGSKYGNKKY